MSAAIGVLFGRFAIRGFARRGVTELRVGAYVSFGVGLASVGLAVGGRRGMIQ